MRPCGGRTLTNLRAVPCRRRVHRAVWRRSHVLGAGAGILPLMWTFKVMVVNVLGDSQLERRLAKEDHPVEALFLDGPDEALGEWTRRLMLTLNPPSGR